MLTKMDDCSTIIRFLRDLDYDQLIGVGLELGLNYIKLKGMKALPGDIVAAWLREEDNVTVTSGFPSLVTALEAVGQKGIASKIREGEMW